MELTEKGKRAGIGAGLFGGAGVLGLHALGALTACFILALATALTGWLASVDRRRRVRRGGRVLGLSGNSKVAQAVPPVREQATESVKEDVQWTKTRAKQARS